MDNARKSRQIDSGILFKMAHAQEKFLGTLLFSKVWKGKGDSLKVFQRDFKTFKNVAEGPFNRGNCVRIRMKIFTRHFFNSNKQKSIKRKCILVLFLVRGGERNRGALHLLHTF